MPVIDAHIHLYPTAFSDDPIQWAKFHGEPWWSHCVAPSEKQSLQGWASPEELIQAMDAAEVDRCVLLGWYWEQEENCNLQNAFYADLIQRFPDRLSAFAAVQPKNNPKVKDSLKKYLDLGFLGIGETKAQVQGFAYRDDCWRTVVDLAAEYRVPINFHVTDPVATPKDAPTRPTPLSEFVDLAKAYPQNTFILAHWGGGLPFYFLNSRLRQSLPNLYFDTAATPLLYDPQVYTRVIDLIGFDRILFGTDFPLLTYPRKMRKPEFQLNLNDVRALNLNPEAEKAILGGNAQNLLFS